MSALTLEYTLSSAFVNIFLPIFAGHNTAMMLKKKLENTEHAQ